MSTEYYIEVHIYLKDCILVASLRDNARITQQIEGDLPNNDAAIETLHNYAFSIHVPCHKKNKKTLKIHKYNHCATIYKQHILCMIDITVPLVLLEFKL